MLEMTAAHGTFQNRLLMCGVHSEVPSASVLLLGVKEKRNCNSMWHCSSEQTLLRT